MRMNEGFPGERGAWLRCYRCWSQRLEAQVHYDAILKVEPETGEAADRIEEVQEAVVQCLDCMHDQPHLAVMDSRVVHGDRRPGPGRDLLGPRGGGQPDLRRLRRLRDSGVLHPRALSQARRGG